jgi:ribosome-associated protein
MNKIKVHKVRIRGNTIRLDQFIKWVGIADTGGQAKELIQCGGISVNGSTETHRGRKLKSGDRVNIENMKGLLYEVLGDQEYAP